MTTAVIGATGSTRNRRRSGPPPRPAAAAEGTLTNPLARITE